MKFGFIRVDGLDFLRGSHRHTVDPRVSMLGTWGTYHGYTVVVTQSGEVWIAFLDVNINAKPNDCVATIRSICSNDKEDRGGKTVGLIFSDGSERFETKDLLKRVSEPWWSPSQP